jgi:3-dehydroquinate dehydratase
MNAVKNPIVTDLFEQHIGECEKKFQAVVNKLDCLESRLDVLEDILIDIKRSLNSLDRKTPELPA